MSMWTAALTGFLGGAVQGATTQTTTTTPTDAAQASTAAKTDAAFKGAPVAQAPMGFGVPGWVEHILVPHPIVHQPPPPAKPHYPPDA